MSSHKSSGQPRHIFRRASKSIPKSCRQEKGGREKVKTIGEGSMGQIQRSGNDRVMWIAMGTSGTFSECKPSSLYKQYTSFAILWSLTTVARFMISEFIITTNSSHDNLVYGVISRPPFHAHSAKSSLGVRPIWSQDFCDVHEWLVRSTKPHVPWITHLSLWFNTPI